MSTILIIIIIVVVCVLSFLTVRVFINNTPNESPAPAPSPAPSEEPMILKITVPSGGGNFELPFTFSSEESITVDWGDGSTGTFSSGDVIHNYKEGEYIITIDGKATSYGRQDYTGANMITEVVSWGTLELTSLFYSFSGATSLTKVPNTIPSTVTNLSAMFYGAINFNQDLNGWDISNVTDISGMFWGATSFNQELTFNTSNVTDMSGMFLAATRFNKDLTFNTSKVTDMSGMFWEATSFNGTINFTDTSNVTAMIRMFYYATSFNKELTFTTSNVTNMSGMFRGATLFDQDLSLWNNLPVLTNAEDIFTNSALLNSAQSSGDYSKYPDFSTSLIPPPQKTDPSDPYYGTP